MTITCYGHHIVTQTTFTPRVPRYSIYTSIDDNTTSSSLFMQIAVHYDGVFYEFVPWNGVVNWEIAQWGSWSMSAENETHKVVDFKLLTFRVILAGVELLYSFRQTSKIPSDSL